MIMNDKLKSLVAGELENFINFWTSDDEEREQMYEVAENYMREDYTYEEPDRLNELEEQAWLHITGEEVAETLRACVSEEVAEEYNKLMSEENGTR